MPCSGPFNFSHTADYICPLPDPDVGLSTLVCDVEHTSFHFGLCGCKFVLCLFGQVSAPYVIAGSTQELYTCTCHICITNIDLCTLLLHVSA